MKFIKNIIKSLKEAQKKRAAWELAEHLVRTNKEFERLGAADVYARITKAKEA